MKKTIRMLLLMSLVMTALVCFAFSSAAYDESGWCGWDVTWTFDYDTGELVISGEGEMYDYSRSEDDWDTWDDFCDLPIESVVIEDGVTRIGEFAFTDFKNIKRVTMADSVTEIGLAAFKGCMSLSDLTLSEGLEIIEGYAFASCGNLINLVIPDSVIVVDYEAFECNDLETVHIGAGVEKLNYHVFYACPNLKSITVDENNQYFSTDQYGVLFNKDKTTLIMYPYGLCNERYVIPDGVTKLSTEAFSGADFSEVVFPDSLTTMGFRAFEYCTNLTDVVIGKNVTNISHEAFEGCRGLTSIYIPDSVTEIGDFAFKNCEKLKSITIPGSVKEIGYKAFEGCASLEEANIDGAKTIEAYAFENCTSLKKLTLGKGVECIEEYAFSGCIGLTELKLPDGISEIGKHVFSKCTNLKSVTIPGSLAEIGECAFYKCTSLSDVKIEEGLKVLGGSAFEDCKALKEITLPEGLETIENSVFMYSGLTGIVIPDSVTHLGTVALANCTNLKTVVIGDGITALNDMAFCYSDVEYLTIGKGLSEIGYQTFYGCDKIKKITVDEENPNYYNDEYGVLYNKDKTTLVLYTIASERTSYEIPDGVTGIYSEAFHMCKNLTKVTIPDSVTIIGSGAFAGCANLSDLSMGNGVKTISKSAFAACYGLRSVTLSASIESVGMYAFSNCENLETVIIPYGVADIGYNAFSDCKKLKSITIPGSVKKIGGEAFKNCTSLSYVKMEEGVEEIKFSVFENCDALVNVFVPKSLKTIGGSAFNNKSNITNLYYAGTKTQFEKISVGEKNSSFVYAREQYNFKGEVPITSATQTTTQITLTWTPVKGAAGYRVYVESARDGWVKLGDTTKTSGTIRNLAVDTVYRFAVRAGRKVGNKIVWDSAYNVIDACTKVPAPTKVTAVQSASAIKLTWNGGPTRYCILYKSGDKWKVCVESTTSNSHTFKNLKAGAKYTFAIRPYMKLNGKIIWSDYITYTTSTLPARVTAKVSSPSSGKISLTWNAVNGADGYQVFYKTNNGSYKLYKVYNSVQKLTFSNLNPKTSYTFVVRAGIRTSGGNIYGAYNSATLKPDGKNSQVLTDAKVQKLWKEANGVYYDWASWGRSKYADGSREIILGDVHFPYYPMVHPTIKTKADLKAYLMKYFDETVSNGIVNSYIVYKGELCFRYPTGKGVKPTLDSVKLKGQAGDYAEMYITYSHQDGWTRTETQKMRYVNGKWIFVEDFVFVEYKGIS